jgi:hypothetical protein
MSSTLEECELLIRFHEMAPECLQMVRLHSFCLLTIFFTDENFPSFVYTCLTTSDMQVLDELRTRGVRLQNVLKNIEEKKYAFNSFQILVLPRLLRPPEGTYGSKKT